MNLHPDATGPMDRNRALLTDASGAYDHVPPTQRLGDMSACRRGGSASADAPAPSSAADQEGRKFCEVVLDGRAAAELRMPGTDGSSLSYRLAFCSFPRCVPRPCSAWHCTSHTVRDMVARHIAAHSAPYKLLLLTHPSVS